MPNLTAAIPETLPDELTQTLAKGTAVRIERIVSAGHASPAGFWYDQQESEFVLLVQGAARIQFEDRIVELTPGDWLDIPAGRRHRVEWTSPTEKTIWLAVFYVAER